MVTQVTTKVGTLENDALVLNGSLDLVCSSHVLEHMSCPRSSLVDVHAKLRVGGLLFVEVPLDSA